MPNHSDYRKRWFWTFAVAALCLFQTGCGDSGPKMGNVTGKVTFTDGSIPTGETAIIRFEPTAESSAEIRKAASATIQPDGTYEIFTMKPGDGAYYGNYKVVFTIMKTYRGGESLVAPEFTQASTTPLQATVDKPSDTQDFKIEKR